MASREYRDKIEQHLLVEREKYPKYELRGWPGEGLVELYKTDPEEASERYAEILWKILTEEIESTPLDVKDLDSGEPWSDKGI